MCCIRCQSVSVRATTPAGGDELQSLVDAFLRELGHPKPLVGLDLAPELEGALQEPPTFLLAILLDQLLDALKPRRSIGVRRTHRLSVWDTNTKYCPLLHTAARSQLAYLRGGP